MIRRVKNDNLQHEFNIVARAQWIDDEVAIPLAGHISEHFFNDRLPQFLELLLIVSVTEALIVVYSKGILIQLVVCFDCLLIFAFLFGISVLS